MHFVDTQHGRFEKCDSSGKTGKLADGRNVNVRVDSSDGRPTLEIMNKNGTRTKVRYDD